MRKKKSISGYLEPKEIQIRQCVYISQDIHKKISKVIALHPDGRTTLGGYIDNVLAEHIKEHKDEINAIYRKQSTNDIV